MIGAATTIIASTVVLQGGREDGCISRHGACVVVVVVVPRHGAIPWQHEDVVGWLLPAIIGRPFGPPDCVKTTMTMVTVIAAPL